MKKSKMITYYLCTCTCQSHANTALFLWNNCYILYLHLNFFHSFHDGSLNLYKPDTTGYYDGSAITGINSPKVTISCQYSQTTYCYTVSVNECNFNTSRAVDYAYDLKSRMMPSLVSGIYHPL